MVSRSVKTQSRKITKRGEMAASKCQEATHVDLTPAGRRWRPVVPVSL